MKKIIAILCSLALTLCCAPISLAASAEESAVVTPENMIGTIVEDFEDGNSHGGVEWGDDGSVSLGHNETGSAWHFTNKKEHYCNTYVYLNDAYKLLPSYVSADNIWVSYDFKGPKALNADYNDGDGNFWIIPRIAFGSTVLRMASADEAAAHGVETGCIYIRAKGSTEWTKYIGYDYSISDSFDGEIAYSLGAFCTDGANFGTFDIDINSGDFKLNNYIHWLQGRDAYGNFNGELQIDNVTMWSKANYTWLTVEDYEDGSAHGDVRWGEDGEVSLGKNETGSAWQFTNKKEHYCETHLYLYEAYTFFTPYTAVDELWIRYELKGPEALNPDYYDDDGTFWIMPGIDKKDGVYYTMASTEIAEANGIPVGTIYMRDSGETAWTVRNGYEFCIPDDFDGEIMYSLKNFCVINGSTYTPDKIDFQSGSFKLHNYFNWLQGVNGAIQIDNVNMLSTAEEKEFVIVEDFEGKAADEIGRTDWDNGAVTVGKNGDNSVWQMTTVKTNYVTAFAYLFDAYKSILPYADANDLWVSYELRGPAAIDSTYASSDGTYQFQPQISDGTTTLRMATIDEATANGIASGKLFLKAKGSEVWTVMTGEKNFKVSDSFEGEVMYNLSYFCINAENDAYTANKPEFDTDKFHLRNFYSSMDDGYDYGVGVYQIDNIALSKPIIVNEAMADGIQYKTLAEAVAAAKETVTLIANVDGNGIEGLDLSGVTLDLGGRLILADTLSVSGSGLKVINGRIISNLTVNGSAVISNVTVDGDFKVAKGCSYKIIENVYTVNTDSIIADINESGEIDAADLIYIRRKLLNTADDDGKFYDINGDGAFDIRDLIRIKRLAVSKA